MAWVSVAGVAAEGESETGPGADSGADCSDGMRKSSSEFVPDRSEGKKLLVVVFHAAKQNFHLHQHQ